ncbi:hypothetical protein M758_1G222100 [Ceratodon purpureus]|nr:hypothetical protein M758_1G222100 [Ceratodon purpureus]
MGSVGDPEENVVEVTDMEFAYGGQAPFISKFSLKLKPGSRCLLIGANGAGKTTLLRILAGKHMVGGKNVVRVLGRSAFHDTALTCSGQLAYLGGSWSRTVGCAGEIPLQGDFTAQHMIFGVENVDEARRARLIELLDIDLRWRMHKVSDGQRRRVQICMGLLQPFQVLLLDEITVDLDVVARMDLLSFFVDECEERGATLIYATHIFDGLEAWATDIAYVEDGKLKRSQPIKEIPELLPPSQAKNLIQVVEPWLRTEREEREKKVPSSEVKLDRVTRPADVSPFTSSRQMAYYR